MPPKQQSLFQVVTGLRHFGVGTRVTRSIWQREPGTFWEVTRVALKEGSTNHGKAYGVFHWKGVAKDGVREIRSPLKKQWQLVSSSSSSSSSSSGAAKEAAP